MERVLRDGQLTYENEFLSKTVPTVFCFFVLIFIKNNTDTKIPSKPTLMKECVEKGPK